ncbi:hypothetical protein RHMOL_Rhmol13G0279300 [Rhododendron molle]|uniref:Uncharacterized protein n=1 Tax=Rhododendron molle TaxID=49168 RepID=A0ACC0LD21_RHOML|nr:hypothetical protein RHMOL_Rhmol13G0279300 [Rhododendron molle]
MGWKHRSCKSPFAKTHLFVLYIRGSDNLSALDMAARNAKKDTLLYLLEFTKDVPFSKLFPDEDSAAHFLILVMTSRTRYN